MAVDGGDEFTVIHPRVIRYPHRRSDPRGRELQDGTIVKCCRLCSYWGDHFCVGYTNANAVGPEEAARLCEEVSHDAGKSNEDVSNDEDGDKSPPISAGHFARLCAADLL